MRVLNIDEDVRIMVREVMEFAEENPLTSMDSYMDSRNGIGDVRYTCKVPDGYNCTFTIIKLPSITIRRLSVYIDTDDKINNLPNIVAFKELLRVFGFVTLELATPDINVYNDKLNNTLNAEEPIH
jgi:hypothetical protein